VKRYLLLAPVAALAAFLFAACGDGPDDDPAPTPTATKSATAAPGAPIVLENPTVTASGLKYVDEVVGTGATPSMSSNVTVHYTGKLAANGEVFDSSVQRGQPATFRMSGVIKGFSEGLSTMKEGGKRTVFIPSALGYGPAGNGPRIPGNSDLIFEIELIKVQ
jgi:peptidylprolyl isomerase